MAEGHLHDRLAGDAAREGSLITAYTVNVDLTDGGFTPRTVSVPVGRPVQLVVRNRGSSEHHYHVAGLHPAAMLWLSKADLLPAGEEVDREHGGHHPQGFLPYHVCTSRTGLCPTGRDVHAHADPRDVDVLVFTPTERGTFDAFCPLHRDLRGTVVVF
jgi:plastocyanin